MDRSTPTPHLWRSLLLVATGLLAAACIEGERRGEPVIRAAEALPHGPSRVTIQETGKGFEYWVNSKPTGVRCVGYNAVTKDATEEDRRARYAADFGLMRASGINTITGWEQEQFDEVLLGEAEEHGIGVIVPFEFYAEWPYERPRFREWLLKAAEAWVRRYQRHPAVRMWGIGNETVWGMPGPDTPEAAAFARLLVEVADRIHQVDPDHPVLYRDAEDYYPKPVADALASNHRPRPWLVYGTNFFREELRDALHDGPLATLGQPLLVSEFASAEVTADGLRGADRPHGYLRMWDIIRTYPGRVLGGCAYVWTTEGPEDLDPSFGLVDGSARPVDSTLAELSERFLAEARREAAGNR